jgi:hypothetical protein
MLNVKKSIHIQLKKLELHIGLTSSSSYNELTSIIMDSSEQGVLKSLVTQMTKFCTVASHIFSIIVSVFSPFIQKIHSELICTKEKAQGNSRTVVYHWNFMSTFWSTEFGSGS